MMNCGNIEYSSNIPGMSEQSTPEKTQLPSLKLFLISYFWFVIYRQNRSHLDTPSSGPEKQASGALSYDLLMEEPVSFCFQQHCCTDGNLRQTGMVWNCSNASSCFPVSHHYPFNSSSFVPTSTQISGAVQWLPSHRNVATWHSLGRCHCKGLLTWACSEFNREEERRKCCGKTQSTTKYCLERHRDLYPVIENTLLQSCSVC